jgi:hypothetical protein
MSVATHHASDLTGRELVQVFHAEFSLLSQKLSHGVD